MASPRSRFVTTTQALRAAMPLAAAIEGVRSLAVNPVPEDVERDGDRIHAVLADGTVSLTAIATSARSITVEPAHGRVSRRDPWDAADAARIFADALAVEVAPAIATTPATLAAPSVGEPADSGSVRVGPKARFRRTTVAIGLIRDWTGDLDGVRGFVVNPERATLEEDEDRVHALMEDGSLSEACLFCGRDGYGISSADGVREEGDPRAAARGFLLIASAEARSPSPTLN